MKLVKPSGDPDKRHIRDYFAHITSGHKRDIEGNVINCRSGGESAEHRNAKHKLREMVGKFTYVTTQCTQCKTKTIEDGQNASILLELQSDDRRWRYDCMLVRDGIRIAALEIFHRHATTDEKLSATRQDGIQIAEFRAEDVNDMQDGMRLRNLSPVSFTCHGCLLKNSKAWILQCYNEERNELRNQEIQIVSAYQKEINQRQQMEEIQRLKDEATKRDDEIIKLSAARHKHNEETLRQRQLKCANHFEENYFSKYFHSRCHPPPYTSERYAPYELICSKRNPNIPTYGQTYGQRPRHRS